MPEIKQQALVAALAAGDDQPQAAFAELCSSAQSLVGHKLFTLMAFDEVDHGACRIFTNMPEAYPLSGKKTGPDDKWSNHVIENRQTFVANTIEEIAQVFPDYELIRSLGCESVINVPIIVADHFLGTINILHHAGYYTPARIRQSELLKLPGAACFLMNLAYYENGKL